MWVVFNESNLSRKKCWLIFLTFYRNKISYPQNISDTVPVKTLDHFIAQINQEKQNLAFFDKNHSSFNIKVNTDLYKLMTDKKKK